MGLLTAAAGVASAAIGARAAKKAGKRAADATTRAAELQVEENRRQYDQTRTDFAPWRMSGQAALGRLDRASTGDMSDFYASPDYKFRRTEGTRDIGNAFSSRGGGGNAMRALAEFSSGLAAGEYGNWFARQKSMADAGRGATSSTAAAGAEATRNITGARGAEGAGLANNYWNTGAAVSNAVQGGISDLVYGVNRWRGSAPGGKLETIDMASLPKRRG